MKTKRLIAALMSLSMSAMALVGCGGNSSNEAPLIMGSSTELSGDFRWAGAGSSSAGASDQSIQRLITGYQTMETDRTGSYVWSETVVKSHTEEEVPNADGVSTNLKITIEINKGLKDSKGKEIKAANYLAYTLAFSSPVGETSQLAYNTAGQSIVGYDDFAAYDGTSGTKYFSGIRLLGDYKFSIEIDGAAGYYPYYFADTYGALSPHPLDLVLGSDVEVKDDGQGAYLTDKWYEKDAAGYLKCAHLENSQYDVDTYAFTGPYTISNWDEGTKEVTLKLNKNYAGNFDGQKPSIQTIVYRKVVSETQMQQLQAGEVDIIEGLTGGDDVNAALALVNKGGFAETHYDRAGYGKLEFECDFGPAMFQEVRQAVAYSFDRNEFANAFCTGYGSIINGPYSVNFQAALDNQAALDKLNDYASSVESAKKVLTEGGWTYNSKGEDLGANWAPGAGVDAVRYKKLAANEYGVDDVNKTYAAVSSDVAYKTVKIGDDYYMPLVINWFASENNEVADLLTTNLKASPILTQAGIVITKTEGSFTKLLGEIYREASYGYAGTPTYNMMNLATGFSSAIYDWSYNWIGNDSPDYDAYFGYSANKLSDPYDAAFQWDVDANKYISFDEAYARSNGKLGMNYISFAMVYSVEPGDTAEYNKWFLAYMQRWNELLPDVPLYCNIYYDVYNSAKLSGLETSPFWGPDREVLYQHIVK